ncbi:hypothetical protein [Georgenia alba]|uniref:DUF4878 domain-containing protein n=1 Tax=Georgenia alba TaxID=2233858 RepID=A0ABW2Q862_9MICO
MALVLAGVAACSSPTDEARAVVLRYLGAIAAGDPERARALEAPGVEPENAWGVDHGPIDGLVPEAMAGATSIGDVEIIDSGEGPGRDEAWVRVSYRLAGAEHTDVLEVAVGDQGTWRLTDTLASVQQVRTAAPGADLVPVGEFAFSVGDLRATTSAGAPTMTETATAITLYPGTYAIAPESGSLLAGEASEQTVASGGDTDPGTILLGLEATDALGRAIADEMGHWLSDCVGLSRNYDYVVHEVCRFGPAGVQDVPVGYAVVRAPQTVTIRSGGGAPGIVTASLTAAVRAVHDGGEEILDLTGQARIELRSVDEFVLLEDDEGTAWF